MYEYAAVVLRVVDGDTVDVDIDLGLDVHRRERLRVLGIDAPEINAKGLEGEEARDYLKALLPFGETVIIRTVKDRKEKYGRYLASIQAKAASGEDFDVASEMLRAGHARPYDGGTR